MVFASLQVFQSDQLEHLETLKKYKMENEVLVLFCNFSLLKEESCFQSTTYLFLFFPHVVQYNVWQISETNDKLLIP